MSNQKQGKSGGGGGGGSSSGGVAGQHLGGMRAEAKKTKAVFKHVLETPFSIPWPEVTPENNAIVLDVLCDLIAPIREYHRTRCSSESKQSTSKKNKNKKNKSKDASKDEEGSSRPNTALATADIDPSPASKEASVSSTSQRPSILDFTIIGINAITKSLERSIQDLVTHPPPSAIFLCKGDLVPAHLYTHLGPMIAMLPKTVVFPLLKGSERKLSEALGMPAVGALAIKARTGQDAADVQCKEADDLIMILERMVEPINVSWLPKVKPPPPPPPATGPKGKRKAQQPKSTLDATTTSVTTAVTTLTVSDDHSATVSAASSTVVSVAAVPEVLTVVSASTSEGSDTRAKQMPGSVNWIPTNIKAVRKDQSQHQGQGKSSSKNKDQQQQSKQQQSKQQQPKQQQPKQQQPKLNKQQQQSKQQPKQQQKQQQQQQQSKNPAQGKKHRAEESAQDRRQDKRPKME
ncbi:hypothetical protein BGX34_002473 [Mortierella sp. NVP85]|nr:hypothetical protein BGX34_002473 [Mortierella sp. NVP85]